jgi:hypothetical protein
MQHTSTKELGEEHTLQWRMVKETEGGKWRVCALRCSAKPRRLDLVAEGRRKRIRTFELVLTLLSCRSCRQEGTQRVAEMLEVKKETTTH